VIKNVSADNQRINLALDADVFDSSEHVLMLVVAGETSESVSNVPVRRMKKSHASAPPGSAALG
jgi:hypothetical protein